MNSPLPPPSPPSNGQSGGVTPPAWQSSPAPAPKSSRGKVIAGIVVAVVVIVAVVIVVASGGADSSGGTIDAKAANSGLQGVYDDVDFDAGSNTADLDRCPFGRVVTLVKSLPKSVSVQDDVISGTDSAVATADPGTVQCDLVADDPGGHVGQGPVQIRFIAELDPPRDYVVRVPDSPVIDVDLDIDHIDLGYRGGQLYGYSGNDPELIRYSGATWVDAESRIAISVTMRGAVASEDAMDSLKAVLDDIISALADKG